MSTSPERSGERSGDDDYHGKFNQSKWYDWVIWSIIVTIAMFSACPWMWAAL